MPDFCLLVVGANMGVQRMTKEHISIACALQVRRRVRMIEMALLLLGTRDASRVWYNLVALEPC